MRVQGEHRFRTVSVPNTDTLKDCTITVRTSLPVKVFRQLEDEGRESQSAASIHFLLAAITDWDGFGLPLTEDGVGELLPSEINALAKVVMEAIANP